MLVFLLLHLICFLSQHVLGLEFGLFQFLSLCFVFNFQSKSVLVWFIFQLHSFLLKLICHFCSENSLCVVSFFFGVLDFKFFSIHFSLLLLDGQSLSIDSLFPPLLNVELLRIHLSFLLRDSNLLLISKNLLFRCCLLSDFFILGSSNEIILLNSIFDFSLDFLCILSTLLSKFSL